MLKLINVRHTKSLKGTLHPTKSDQCEKNSSKLHHHDIIISLLEYQNLSVSDQIFLNAVEEYIWICTGGVLNIKKL